MKNILVPTDFSPNAYRAINYAVEIARRNGATVNLLHCVSNFIPAITPSQQNMSDEYNTKLIQSAKEELNLLQKSIEDTENIAVKTHIFEGAVKEGIIKTANDLQANWVCMGTVGKSAIRERILGSVTASLIGDLNQPLMAIPLEFEWQTPRKMAYAVQEFEEALQLAKPIVELSQIFGANLVLTIFTDEDKKTAFGSKNDEAYIESCSKVLQQLYSGSRIEAKQIKGSRFVEAVEGFIDENEIDLLAMINHPQNIIQSIFHQSFSKKMAYQSRIPLLILKGHHA